MPASRSSQVALAERDPAAVGPVQPGDRPQHGALAGARRADQRQAAPGLDLELDLELELAQDARIRACSPAPAALT